MGTTVAFASSLEERSFIMVKPDGGERAALSCVGEPQGRARCPSVQTDAHASSPPPAYPCASRAVHRGLIGDIIKRFEQKGYKLVGCKVLVPSTELASAHYAEHEGERACAFAVDEQLQLECVRTLPDPRATSLAGKPFFPKLVSFLTSGAVVALCFEGKGVVKTGRQMIGATNPLASAPGTIRGDVSCMQAGALLALRLAPAVLTTRLCATLANCAVCP